tara:strand:- start:3833 stop:4720 length:888 start_codon:yes stop_codon:yes gene_type:complete
MAEAAEVMEQTEVQPQKKVVGFAKRSVNKERIEKEEKEIEELKKQNLEQVDVTPEEKEEPEPTTAEERSFKKRYGDLRRHSQKKEHDLQKQIDELRNQLDASTKKQIKLPKSEEELDEWTKEYPDVAQIVETIAIKKAKEQSKDIEDKLKKINAMQEDALREKAEVLLLKKHPDFVEIREQDEFHNWVEEQPEWVQKALYENEHDANSAARAIDLYKADMGISTKKITTKDKELSAAKSVGKTQKKNPDSSSEIGMIKESDVEKMTPKQYEANAESIQKAMQSGKFIYDLTGSAR